MADTSYRYTRTKKLLGQILKEMKACHEGMIQEALSVNDRPVLIDFVVHRDAMVWPMVPAGVSNDKIMDARDAAPVWERED